MRDALRAACPHPCLGAQVWLGIHVPSGPASAAHGRERDPAQWKRKKKPMLYKSTWE